MGRSIDRFAAMRQWDRVYDKDTELRRASRKKFLRPAQQCRKSIALPLARKGEGPVGAREETAMLPGIGDSYPHLGLLVFLS
jgi:hypothetical protein